MHNIEEQIICPISKKIFLNPVTLEDGHTYENDEIEQWLLNKNTSPITREILISKKYSTNILIKQIVEKYLLENNDKSIEQYKESTNFNYNKFINKKTYNEQIQYLEKCDDLENAFIINNSCYSTKIVKIIIGQNNIANKLDILKFLVTKKINKQDNYFITSALDYRKFDMVKCIIENDDNKELKNILFTEYNFISYVCSNLDFLKFAIKNGANLHSYNNLLKRVLHSYHLGYDVIKFLIEQNIDTKTVGDNDISLLNYFILLKNQEMFEYCLTHNVNMLPKELNKKKLIMYVCEKGTTEMIKTMINLNYHNDCNVLERFKIIKALDDDNFAKKYFNLKCKKRKLDNIQQP